MHSKKKSPQNQPPFGAEIPNSATCDLVMMKIDFILGYLSKPIHLHLKCIYLPQNNPLTNSPIKVCMCTHTHTNGGKIPQKVLQARVDWIWWCQVEKSIYSNLMAFGQQPGPGRFAWQVLVFTGKGNA